jgi:hypothetical protein
MAIPAAAAIGVGALTGIGNFIANQNANDRAMMMYNKNFQEWMDINIPDPEEQKLVLEKFVSQGELDPVMQQAIAADPSAFEEIVTDSQYKGAQNRALLELENIGLQGGMRLQDKAALQEAMLGAQTRDRANRQGIMDEMSRRGQRGSGVDLAARLQGQQAVADRDAQSSLSVAAKAQDRALQSLMGAGDLATKYRGQDFGEQSAKASAIDRINMFNTANLRDVNAANVTAQNRAQQFNLANKQRIADQNTQLANAQQQFNKGLIQKQFDNRMTRQAGASGQIGNMTKNVVEGGKNLGNTISNIGGGISDIYAIDAKYGDQNNYGYEAEDDRDQRKRNAKQY